MLNMTCSDLLKQPPVDILGTITPLLDQPEQRDDFPWELVADVCDSNARQ
jgi:hypothetical protein